MASLIGLVVADCSLMSSSKSDSRFDMLPSSCVVFSSSARAESTKSPLIASSDRQGILWSKYWLINRAPFLSPSASILAIIRSSSSDHCFFTRSTTISSFLSSGCADLTWTPRPLLLLKSVLWQYRHLTMSCCDPGGCESGTGSGGTPSSVGESFVDFATSSVGSVLWGLHRVNFPFLSTMFFGPTVFRRVELATPHAYGLESPTSSSCIG